MIEQLEKIYILKNPDEIRDFLLENDYLMEILLEAPSHIHRIFGQVSLILELDNSEGEEWNMLFIIIKSSFDVKEALNRETQLMDEWFLDKMEATRGRLSIVEEPI